MSTTVDVGFAFDTHKFVKQMVATGFTEEQAEAQVRLLSEILHTQLSTKADVAKVDMHVLELKRDIETTKAELKRDIETIQAELKRDIEAIDAKVEATRAELKRDIAAMATKLESTKSELQKEIFVSVANAKTEIIKWVVGMGVVTLGGVMTINRVLPPVPVYYQPPAQELRLPAPPPAAPAPPQPAR
ncbi:MAG: CCDC90 family protein [Magnetococcus sp. XQGC-1]